MENPRKINTLANGAMLNWYEIRGILGKGGFGVTYLAHDTNLQMQVAIKEYLPDQIAARASDNSVKPITEEEEPIFTWGLDRFINEARTLVKFKHANIVRVMSVFEANGTAYMVMEFEEGQNLKEFLRNPDHSNEATLRSIVTPILDGLKEVHRHGFIHRDIKPANIYVREDHSPVLLDFGSARQALNSQSQKLTAMVTVGYAPLEQYNEGTDSQQGPWTDIYAMGAVLYFAMSGTPPLESTLRASAVLNDRPDPLPSAREVARKPYGQSFLEGIDWALQFKVSDRPATVDDWRVRLLANDNTVISPREVPLDPTVLHPVAPQFSKPSGASPGAAPKHFRDAETVLSGPPKEQSWHVADLSQPAPVRQGSSDQRQAQNAVSGRKRIGFMALLAALPLLVAGTAGYFWLEGKNTENTGTEDGNAPINPAADPNQHEIYQSIEAAINAGDLDRAWNILDTVKIENTTESKNRYSAISNRLLNAQNAARKAEEDKTRLLAAAKAQRDADEKVRLAAEAKTKREAEEKEKEKEKEKERARLADQAKAQREVEEAQLAAEAEARSEAEKKAQLAAEAKARREAEEKAQLAAEAQAQREAEEKARLAAEAQAQHEAEEKARLAAAAQAQREAEEKAQLAAEAQAQREKAEKARLAAEATANRIADETTRLANEAKAKRETAEKARLAAAAIVRREAEQKARLAAEEKARAAEAAAAKTISSADMDEVLARFDQLKRAIERKDTAVINALVVKSNARSRFFAYVFENFVSLDTSLSSITSQNGTQTITARLKIDRMFKLNGDIALPATAHRDIAIYCVREAAGWSKIHW